MKRELERAIKAAGSVPLLARAIGFTASTIRRWRRDGVPKKRSRARAALEEFKGSRKAALGRKKSDLQLLKTMLAEARKVDAQNAEAENIKKTLIRPKTFTKKTSGRLTEGMQAVKAFNRELTHAFMRELQTWVRSHRGNHPLWQIRVVVAQFSAEQDFGPRTDSNRISRVFVRGENANLFLSQKVMPSPAAPSLSKAWGFIGSKLNALIESESTTFVLTADVYNYRRRSADEIRARETAARRKRPRFKKKGGENVRLRNQFQ